MGGLRAITRAPRARSRKRECACKARARARVRAQVRRSTANKADFVVRASTMTFKSHNTNWCTRLEHTARPPKEEEGDPRPPTTKKSGRKRACGRFGGWFWGCAGPHFAAGRRSEYHGASWRRGRRQHDAPSQLRVWFILHAHWFSARGSPGATERLHGALARAATRRVPRRCASRAARGHAGRRHAARARLPHGDRR